MPDARSSGPAETTWVAPVPYRVWTPSPPTPPSFYLDANGRIIFMPPPIVQLQPHDHAGIESYGFDFTTDLTPGETISANTVVLTSTDSQMVLSNAQVVGGFVSFLMQGGTQGAFATLVCMAPTSLGQKLVGKFIVEVI